MLDVQTKKDKEKGRDGGGRLKSATTTIPSRATEEVVVHQSDNSLLMRYLYEGDGYVASSKFEAARRAYENQIVLIRANPTLNLKLLSLCHGRLGRLFLVHYHFSSYPSNTPSDRPSYPRTHSNVSSPCAMADWVDRSWYTITSAHITLTRPLTPSNISSHLSFNTQHPLTHTSSYPSIYPLTPSLICSQAMGKYDRGLVDFSRQLSLAKEIDDEPEVINLSLT